MTNGSPASAAGPSTGEALSSTRYPVNPSYLSSDSKSNTEAYISSVPLYYPAQPTSNTAYAYAHGTPSTSTSQTYQGGSWQAGWPAGGYAYSAGPLPTYQQPPYSQYRLPHYQPQPLPASYSSQKPPQKDSSLSPSPPPPRKCEYWDEAIKSFLGQAGLTQSLRGFEADILVMNSDWEQETIPGALDKLVENIKNVLSEKADQLNTAEVPSLKDRKRLLDERKLDYIHLDTDAEPRSQTSVTKSISTFLAQNRSRNNASNRAEFLHSLAEKRRRLGGDDPAKQQEVASCARTDAKPLDRDVQMKYDIAKNEDGPLRRTTRAQPPAAVPPQNSSSVAETGPDAKFKNAKGKQKNLEAEEDRTTAERHPGLNTRVANIETHLSIRYVPSPPRTLLARIKFLEDHIVQLEKDYPPWAALHFNQPNRGWPPPPRPTPIIVPPQLRSTAPADPSGNAAGSNPAAEPPPLPPDVGGGSKMRNSTSSLHRAVLEKLEVQKAMNDLAGAA